MPKSDIVVIGASAGGLEAVREIVRQLPADLSAAVFVVIHIGNGCSGRSYLPEILNATGPLAAKQPTEGEAVKHGVIYVARPDHHLLIRDGRIHHDHGPKINLTRPAINPLFRTAAACYGDRVTGVVLSGQLDDGAAGIAEIKRQGGITIAQNPETALYPSMPFNAVLSGFVDHVLELSEIAPKIVDLSRTENAAMEIREPVERKLTPFPCPGCQGPIWREQQGTIVEFICRVGHTYSPLSMQAEYERHIEQTLWHGVVALRTVADFTQQLSRAGDDEYERIAAEKRSYAQRLEAILKESNPDELPKTAPED